jgi:hypothetical protein
MAQKKYTPELIEQAKAFHALGWSANRIAKEMGVTPKTMGRWLEKPDPSELSADLIHARAEVARKWVAMTWNQIDQLSAILQKKINKGEGSFKDAREIATVIGILMDKVGSLEAKRRVAPQKPNININILPPGDYGNTSGHTTRVIADAVPVYDIPGEVHGDDNGGGGGQDVRRMLESCEDGDREPVELRDDSSLDLPQPIRFCDPDDNRGDLGSDGAAGSV